LWPTHTHTLTEAQPKREREGARGKEMGMGQEGDGATLLCTPFHHTDDLVFDAVERCCCAVAKL